MKKDITLVLENGSFDLVIEDGDFKNDPGFETALWVSLFTDARAPESKVLLPENRRGWLGNTVSEVEERELGGLLWLAEQRRLNQDTVNEIEDYARKSLDWFLEDGIAVKIEVNGEIYAMLGIALNIRITALNGVTSDHFIPLWEVTGSAY